MSQDVLPAFTGMPASELRLRLFMQHRILLKMANLEKCRIDDIMGSQKRKLLPDEIQ